MPKKKITLKITGRVNYATAIDEALAGRIIALCGARSVNQETGDVEMTNDSSLSKGVVRQHGSIIEYMDKFNPKRNPDKILAIAAYLKEKHNQGFFKPNDIKPYFAKAGEPVPGNFNRDFKWLQKSKWIAEAEDQRGYFYVTTKGLNVVHSGFPKELIAESRGKANISRSRKKKDSIHR